MKSLILIMALLCLGQVKGQIIQVGFSGTISNTFFHAHNSEYDQELFRSRSKLGIGVSLPVYINLTEKISIKSGIGIQNKAYQFEQYKFNFPEVEEGIGSFYFKMKHRATELPLIFCYRMKELKKGLIPELKIGAVFVKNTPKVIGIGYKEPKYNGSDSLFSGSMMDSFNFSSTFSTDLYIGISLFKNKGNFRNKELTISYQYGFGETTTNYFYTVLMTPATPKRIQVAVLSPRLSYIGISYSYFPNWLAFGKTRKREDK
jgi:hypothetical protein